MADKRQAGQLKRAAFLFSSLLTLAVVVCVLSLALVVGVFFSPGPQRAGQVIILDKGQSLTQASRMLEAQGLIHNQQVFRIMVRAQGLAGRMRAGEFYVPLGASMADIQEILINGQVVLHPITLPEGLTSQQIVTILEASPVLEGEVDVPPEGALLPETYYVPRGQSRAALIAEMMRAQQALMQALWVTRQANLPFTTQREALILASIVEKETSQTGERAMVAAVFVNRLKKKMRLQADPTVIYGLVQGKGTLGRPIRRSELKRKTAYNTYQINGLPPTPIANPGRAALAAVLNPAASNALYFVADGAGGHVFTDKLEVHNRNVARWRKIEKSRAR